jgi:hypothetical protein
MFPFLRSRTGYRHGSQPRNTALPSRGGDRFHRGSCSRASRCRCQCRDQRPIGRYQQRCRPLHRELPAAGNLCCRWRRRASRSSSGRTSSWGPQRVSLTWPDIGQLTESVHGHRVRLGCSRPRPLTRIHTIESEIIQRRRTTAQSVPAHAHSAGVTKTDTGARPRYASWPGGRRFDQRRAYRRKRDRHRRRHDTRPNRGVNFISRLDSLGGSFGSDQHLRCTVRAHRGGVNVFGSKSGTNSFHGAA